jgi:DNA-binding response OmpR family regulator
VRHLDREAAAGAQAKDARATAPKPPQLAVRAKNVACFGEAFLDFDARRLIDRNGADMPITATEFEMLSTFARHPNKVLTRDHLLGEAPEHGSGCCDRAIDIRVTRIRKRIEVNPTRPQVIRTVRSVGYVYVPPA